MCRLRNIAMRDYQESVTTRQTHGQTDGQTDAGQSDPYVPLCFAGNTKSKHTIQTVDPQSLIYKYPSSALIWLPSMLSITHNSLSLGGKPHSTTNAVVEYSVQWINKMADRF